MGERRKIEMRNVWKRKRHLEICMKKMYEKGKMEKDKLIEDGKKNII